MLRQGKHRKKPSWKQSVAQQQANTMIARCIKAKRNASTSTASLAHTIKMGMVMASRTRNAITSTLAEPKYFYPVNPAHIETLMFKRDDRLYAN
jgi:hypothetical protein